MFNFKNFQPRQKILLIISGLIVAAFLYLNIKNWLAPKLTTVPPETTIINNVSTSTNANVTTSAQNIFDQETALKNYLNADLGTLSPVKETLGGKFYITSLKMLNERQAVITYEDGHIALSASLDFAFAGSEPQISNFNILTLNGKAYQP